MSAVGMAPGGARCWPAQSAGLQPQCAGEVREVTSFSCICLASGQPPWHGAILLPDTPLRLHQRFILPSLHTPISTPTHPYLHPYTAFLHIRLGGEGERLGVSVTWLKSFVCLAAKLVLLSISKVSPTCETSVWPHHPFIHAFLYPSWILFCFSASRQIFLRIRCRGCCKVSRDAVWDREKVTVMFPYLKRSKPTFFLVPLMHGPFPARDGLVKPLTSWVGFTGH